jgi:hypothetical protein
MFPLPRNPATWRALNQLNSGQHMNGVHPSSSWVKIAVAIIAALGGVLAGWVSAYVTTHGTVEKAKQIVQDNGERFNLREGHYHWEWAGDGWMGDITVSKDSAGQPVATIDVRKYCGSWKHPIGKVIASEGPGSIGRTPEGLPKLLLPVKFTEYGDNCKASGQKSETLQIVLNPKEAYTGSIDYIDASGSQAGKIGLINWEYQPVR